MEISRHRIEKEKTETTTKSEEKQSNGNEKSRKARKNKYKKDENTINESDTYVTSGIAEGTANDNANLSTTDARTGFPFDFEIVDHPHSMYRANYPVDEKHAPNENAFFKSLEGSYI